MARLPRTARMRHQRLTASANSLLVPSGRSKVISRSGGGYTAPGTGNWSPRRITYREESRQRELLANRAADLVANDPHAASLIDVINVNTVGPGLWPQSKPNWKRLGISEDQATEIAEAAEWEFEHFNLEADARGISTFKGIQFQNLWSMLVNGEFLNLPLMLDGPEYEQRHYRLALQVIAPSRLRTPADLGDNPSIRDGIRLGRLGDPTGYFISDPTDGVFASSLSSNSFVELPPLRGHRPVVMHRFYAKEPEQTRGFSVLGPAMMFFRNLADYLDYELIGAIVAASFPVFVEKQDSYDATTLPGVNRSKNAEGNPVYHQTTEPGTVLYGNPGEKPHILKSDRPGSSFEVFVEKVLRGAGAVAGMPYELVAKDFSKTNYSSARAALQEAWRVFELYQDWLITYFCQPIWNMFFEEAVLTGRIKLPAGAPNFYACRAEYCTATWVDPERTNVDPVKEMVADIMGLNAGIVTMSDMASKRNKDWESQAKQRSRERKTFKELGLNPDPPSVKEAKDPAKETEEETG